MGKFDMAANAGMDLIFGFLQQRMAERKTNVLKLSELIGVSPSTLTRNFRRESEMSFSTYLKICGALELRPYLVTREDDDTEMERIYFN